AMDLSSSVSDFQDKAWKLWEALKPRLSELQEQAKEACAPHVEWAKSAVIEASNAAVEAGTEALAVMAEVERHHPAA
ncbi:unnamed protein product, partial [Symbiodinium pilosum]